MALDTASEDKIRVCIIALYLIEVLQQALPLEPPAIRRLEAFKRSLVLQTMSTILINNFNFNDLIVSV